MKCSNCGQIIHDNSLNCPYCGKPVSEDYFGYRSADERFQQQQNAPKKDNSGKIVLIILSSLAGVMIIVVMLVVLFSSGGSSQTEKVEGSFTIAPEFEFSVQASEKSAGTDEYYIYVTSDNMQEPLRTTVTASETTEYKLSEGEYSFMVMRSASDVITLTVTVDADCEYNTAYLYFDDRQVKTTNGLTVQGQTAAAQTQTKQYYPTELTVYTNGELSRIEKLSYDIDSNMVYECSYYNSSGDVSSGDTYSFLCDNDGKLNTIDDIIISTTISGTVNTYNNKYTFEYDGERVSKYTISYEQDEYTQNVYTYNGNGQLTEINTNGSGGYSSATSYEYDSKGRLIGSIYDCEYEPYGDTKTSIEYGSNGLVSKYTVSSTDTDNIYEQHEYKYDSDNKLIYQKRMNDNDVITSEEIYYKYNDKGLILSIDTDYTDYAQGGSKPNGTIKQVKTYEYDSNSRLVKVTQASDGEISSVYTIEYDSDGNISTVEVTYYESNGNTYIYKYVYSGYKELDDSSIDQLNMYQRYVRNSGRIYYNDSGTFDFYIDWSYLVDI